MENGLITKLHPRRFPGMSPKMAAIVAYVLGKEWTTPSIAWLSVTSDGLVMSDSHFIGHAGDLDRNVVNLLAVAGLTAEERAEWDRLYRLKVDDWRNSPRE